ncbi:VOC family protein [Silicimonas algicola]|uniref:VOC domain-containing protein n=1 Tax=Silicimonas algicola TaxID=1826607 RepID=A0A316G8Q7_9RHOB|nr:VOC family protein [Silicimonas algicola]AZQ65657.1 VOC family protein [Silicimonas algicola]PWK56595.1 hypothetical protein C8D95_104268 [Silicimonas algicola]
MTRQRVSLVTLGVRDLEKAKSFYAALGWVPVQSPPSVAFYRMDGLVVALFGLSDLAEDQGRKGAELGFGAATLAQNYPDRESTDAAFEAAIAAGATVLKRPEEVFWGGYSGYYADPDGHVWEVAHNPFWEVSDTGRVTIPDEA